MDPQLINPKKNPISSSYWQMTLAGVIWMLISSKRGQTTHLTSTWWPCKDYGTEFDSDLWTFSYFIFIMYQTDVSTLGCFWCQYFNTIIWGTVHQHILYSSVLVNSVMANTAALTVIKAKKAWCSQGTVSKNINGRWTGGDNSIK